MTNLQKNNEIMKKRIKPEAILLGCILLMQIAIFAYIYYSGKLHNNHNTHKELSACPVDIRNSHKWQKSPFTAIDIQMEKLMNAAFNSIPASFSHHNALQRHRQIMRNLQNTMKQMADFQNAMNIDSGWEAINISPAMDMREKSNSYEVVFCVPPGTSSNITVKLNGNLLSMVIPIKISTPHYSEYRTYEQHIMLPGAVKANKNIKAAVSNGMLRVTLLKAE